MAPEINWTRSLKNKLQVWRGSRRRPKSVKKIPVLSPTEYRQQWPFSSAITSALGGSFSAKSGGVEGTLERYVREIEEGFGPSVEDDTLPDPIYDAICAFVRASGTSKELTDFWFQGGLSYALRVFLKWSEARDIVRRDSNFHSTADEAVVRELLVRFRRQLIALGDKEYDALVALAGEHFAAEETSLEGRAFLANLFPDQMEWGNTVIDELPQLVEDSFHYNPTHRSYLHFLMFASGADLPHLLKLVGLCDPSEDSAGVAVGWRYHIADELAALYALLDRLEFDAHEVLFALSELPWNSQPSPITEVLCHIPTQEVFDGLAMRWEKGWEVIPEYRAFLLSEPEMAFAALSKRDDRSGDITGELQQIYEALEQANKRLTAEAEDDLHFATREDFEGVLAAPPWLADKSKKSAKSKTIPKSLKGIELLEDVIAPRYPDKVEEARARHDSEVAKINFEKESNAWKKESRGRLLSFIEDPEEFGYVPAFSYLELVDYETAGRFIDALPEERLLGLHVWDIDRGFVWFVERPELLRAWFGNTTDKDTILKASKFIAWPGLAPTIAEMLGTKTMRDGALQWIEANPRDAAIGGIPAYMGTRGAKKKKHLGEMLRVARHHDEEAFDEVVDAYAEKHGEELRDFLPDFEDAATAYPKKMPSLPVFWSPAAYPPILLEKDLSKRIPVEICDDIAHMLKFSPPGKPYVGLLELKEQADATSLGEFTWALFQSWIEAGCPLDEEWVIQGLALFGGPEVARELSYQLDSWLRTDYYKRGEKILEAISPGCNEYTLEALWRYHHGGHTRDALQLTTRKLRELFEEESWTDFEPHFDRSAPTFGIGKDHRIKLGGASGQGLKVWLDEDLEPHLSDSGAGFDELDEPTRLRWERLGRLCAWQARFQSRRFERAMRTQRAWSIEDWQNDILEHPLLGMLAHKLLWGVYKGYNLVQAFRIDEENAPVDIEDDPLELTSFTAHDIRIIHPAQMVSEDIIAWTQTFSDYEVIQPFEQLARKTWEAEDAEALIRGELASFNSTLGALQQMFEDHDWGCSTKRKRSYPITKITRGVHLQRSRSVRSVEVKTKAAYYQGFFPGVRTDDQREVQLEVKLGRKDTNYSTFSKVDLSELVWELERARFVGK